METVKLVTIILGTSTLVAALNVILSNIVIMGKWGNTAIAKYINKIIDPHFKDVHKSLDSIQEQINEIRDTNDKRELQRLRYECLCFASDVRKGVKKTPREYEEIFRMEETYETLIKKYDIHNGFMVEEMRYVHEQYRKIEN